MAKDNTFYFSHDYNTRIDNKVRRLILKHGMVGYGIFWAIVEDLYNNANALPTDYELIAFYLRVKEDLVKSVINDFGLFVIENDTFGSASVERRLNERNLKSENARKSALNRWNKSERNANALQSQSEGNAIKENKEKENKEKENKEDDDENQTPPPSSPKIDLSGELFNGLNEEFAEYVQNCINSRAPIFLKKEIANKRDTYFRLVKNILKTKKSMKYLRSKETNETLEDCEKIVDKALVDWLKEQTEGKIEHSWDSIPDIAQHALNYIRKQKKLTDERTKSHLGTSSNKHTGAIETKSNDYSRTGW